jgi:O-methyltransferase
MLKKLVRRLIGRVKRSLCADIYSRLDTLEYRSFNRRFYAIEQCTEYLVGAKIDGDYLEFGVYQGTTLSHAYQWMVPHFKEMRFLAFDSFEGLPVPKGIDIADGYSSHFYEKQFSCSQEEFAQSIRSKGVDLSKVSMTKGWFDKTLSSQRAQELNLKAIAVAWIDCDYYESTVPVLKFITPYLTVGSVIIFDDWRCYRNHPDFGEQRACKEWLESNNQIQLAELFSFGWNGIAFTVISC